MKTRKISARMITHLAVFIALQMVLQYVVAINTPIVRIGFGFVPVALCGMLYGPVWSVAVAVIADIVGSAFLSSGWFPPLTITAILYGLLYGLLLNLKRNPGLVHTTVAAAVYNFALSLCLQTYFLSLLMGEGYMVIFPTRVVQVCVMFVIQAVMLPMMVRFAKMLSRQMHLNEASSGA